MNDMYQKPEPMPDYWIADCKTEEEIKNREYEWAYYQCQRNKDYFRALVHNISTTLKSTDYVRE